MHHFSSRTIFLLLIGGGAFVLWLLLAGAGEEGGSLSDGEVEIEISPEPSPTTDRPTEHFQGGCPPSKAMARGEKPTDYPPQEIDPRLFDLMQEETMDSLGGTHCLVQTRAFCLFTGDDGRVKGIVNPHYSWLGPEHADPFVALVFWMSKEGIDPRTVVCEIDWDWDPHPCESEDPVEEVPPEPEEQQEPEEEPEEEPERPREGGRVIV
jgi:hypothetical protein